MILVLLVGGIGYPVGAEEVDPKTDQALTLMIEMGRYFGSLENFSFQSRSSFEEMISGQAVDFSQTSDVYVSRGHGLRVNSSGDRSVGSLFYGGGYFVAYDRKTNFFAATEYSGGLGELADHLATKFGQILPAAEFLHDDPAERMLENIQTIFYVGFSSVEGVMCHHIAARTKSGVEWQIWLEDGLLLPRKIVVRDADIPGSPKTVAYFSDWNVNPKFPELLFHFVPPTDSVEIEFKENVEGKK